MVAALPIRQRLCCASSRLASIERSLEQDMGYDPRVGPRRGGCSITQLLKNVRCRLRSVNNFLDGEPLPQDQAASVSALQSIDRQLCCIDSRLDVIEDYMINGMGYWLDGVNGNDANTGLRRSEAVKTPSRLMAVTGGVIAGKAARIARGSVFNQQLSLSGNNSLITSYGDPNLALPIFDASDLIPAFTKTVGRTFVYEAPITVPVSVKIMGNAFAGNETTGVYSMLIQVSTLALCDSTAGSFYVPNTAGYWTSGASTVYVHPVGDAVPIADGKDYRVTIREYGVFLIGENVSINRIQTQRNSNQDGSTVIYGNGAHVVGAVFNDACRHATYARAGSLWEDCSWTRGRNDLEAPGSSNSLVINETDITGKSWATLRCTFDAGDGGPYTGPYGHGSSGTQMFAQVDHTEDNYIKLSGTACVAVVTNFNRCKFTNCINGISFNTAGITANVNDCTGTFTNPATPTSNNFVSGTSSGTINSNRNTFTVVSLATGFYRLESSSTGDCALNIDGDTITVQGTVAVVSRMIRWHRGPVSVKNSRFYPDIFNHTDILAEVGFSGGTGTYAGLNNVYPIGTSWLLNGTYYYTLAALQTAGFDTGSTYAPEPSPFSTDDFAGDGFLDTRPGWTRAGGAGVAGSMVTAGGMLGCANATNISLYVKDYLASSDHWVSFTVQAAPAQGPYVSFRIIDVDNWWGIRWTSTAFQVARMEGGVITQSVIASGAGVITPAIGQKVYVGVRGTTVFIIVDNKTVLRGTITNNGGVGVGVVGRSAVVNPFIDNYACGALSVIP